MITIALAQNDPCLYSISPSTEVVNNQTAGQLLDSFFVAQTQPAAKMSRRTPHYRPTLVDERMGNPSQLNN
jgi:hypothetical protein